MPSIEQARTWYPTNDPVHGFDHVMRVYTMAERLALDEGADLEIVRAAALLHDAYADAWRADHHLNSTDFAGQILAQEGWPPDRIAAVQHCIRTHRFRDSSQPPLTLEAQILFDADKLDAIGAIGVARAIGYAVRAGQPPFAQPSPDFLETGHTGPDELHSAYHEYLFKLRKLQDRLYTPTARAIGIERHLAMEAFFERLAAEIVGLL